LINRLNEYVTDLMVCIIKEEECADPMTAVFPEWKVCRYCWHLCSHREYCADTTDSSVPRV